MEITTAERNDLEWVNSKYAEINFVKSNFDKEFIAVARIENQNAGLGRLVKIDDKNIELGGIYTFPEFRSIGVAENIVAYLCKKNPFKQSIIWCLPFENLSDFYCRFGFEKYQDGDIPKEINEKLEWCNTNDKYKKKVILLYKKE